MNRIENPGHHSSEPTPGVRSVVPADISPTTSDPLFEGRNFRLDPRLTFAVGGVIALISQACSPASGTSGPESPPAFTPTPIVEPVDLVSVGSVDQRSHIRPIDYVLHPGLENPIYRAGSIILSVADGSKHGQGSLVQTKDGLAILTVDHVAKILGEGSKFYVPGVGTDTLDVTSYVSQPKITKDNDPIALIPLRLPPDHPLLEVIANGSITPLKLTSPGAKLILREVAIPNPVMSEFTKERVTSYNPETNQYRIEKNLFCQGQSGSPVLLMENGRITNQAVGVISGLPDPLLEDPLGRFINGRSPVYCGNTIVVRANN